MTSAWAQVDAFRSAAQTEFAKADREWRAFAKIEVDLWNKLRFRARPSDPRIKVERPCSLVPGKWRANGYFLPRQLVADAERAAAKALAAGKKAPLLTPARARAILVAHDKWIEGGAKRMTRPLVIP